MIHWASRVHVSNLDAPSPLLRCSGDLRELPSAKTHQHEGRGTEHDRRQHSTGHRRPGNGRRRRAEALPPRHRSPRRPPGGPSEGRPRRAELKAGSASAGRCCPLRTWSPHRYPRGCAAACPSSRSMAWPGVTVIGSALNSWIDRSEACATGTDARLGGAVVRGTARRPEGSERWQRWSAERPAQLRPHTPRPRSSGRGSEPSSSQTGETSSSTGLERDQDLVRVRRRGDAADRPRSRPRCCRTAQSLVPTRLATFRFTSRTSPIGPWRSGRR